MRKRFVRSIWAASVLVAATGRGAVAQTPPVDQSAHEHAAMAQPAWSVMQAGAVYALYNRQGSDRGGVDTVVPNWWMGMLTGSGERHQLTVTTMFSADRATVGRRGYREIFQVGEALDGEPIVDRQHPHDFFMQLAAAWRWTPGGSTSVTLAGGPAGEAAIGPPAFMHRASAAAIPLAPLSHHTFDSTHIAYGVLSAAVERGRWTVESSVFNGREPDEDRWDIDLGRLDSVSGRVWVRPTPEWEIQVSTGRLVEPERVAGTTLIRTTASASWLQLTGERLSALTIGYGVNAADGARRQALLGEYTRQLGDNLISSRLEFVEVETGLLLGHGHDDHANDPGKDGVGVVTVGGMRELGRWRGMDAAVGADVNVYAVPAALQPEYGRRPVSLQIFFQIRPATGLAGRMWNMRMGKPMPAGHAGMNHAM